MRTVAGFYLLEGSLLGLGYVSVQQLAPQELACSGTNAVRMSAKGRAGHTAGHGAGTGAAQLLFCASLLSWPFAAQLGHQNTSSW